MKLSKSEHTIIHSATVAAGIVGASPIPFSDAVLLVPIQTTMIVALYKRKGLTISQGVVKGLLKATLISGFGKSLAGNLFKFIPGVGTIAGGVINTGVAVTFTEFLGFSVAKELHEVEDVDILELTQVIASTIKTFSKG
ncbi:GTPase [Vagococcus fluvialis]|nr:GTPase [Vagococcus fluvialis]